MSSAVALPRVDRDPRRRRDRRSPLLLLAGCAAARPGPRCAPANAPSARRTTTCAVVEYTKAVRANPDDRTARLALERARLRASQEHFFPRPAARRRGTARRGAGRVPARVRAESRRPRRRRRAAGCPPEAAHEARGLARRPDRAAGADRADARPRAAGPGAARRRQAARLAGVRQREQPDRCS